MADPEDKSKNGEPDEPEEQEWGEDPFEEDEADTGEVELEADEAQALLDDDEAFGDEEMVEEETSDLRPPGKRGSDESDESDKSDQGIGTRR